MPRQAKGPRLWLRKERFDKAGRRISAAAWIIIDGTSQIATGCAPDEADEAERQLAEYNVTRYRPTRKERDIESISIADVLMIYEADKGPSQANQRTFTERMLRLNDWWGEKMLDEVNGATCREYTAWREAEFFKEKTRKGGAGGARRDLEDLRAAINHHAKEGLHRGVVRVSLPEKGETRDRWLTRAEAAQLLWALWRFREMQRRHRGPDKGLVLPTKRYPLRHIARFVLIGLYTGSRAATIATASPHKAEGRGWVDLERGIYYRKPIGKKATNKRQPPVRLPPRLLTHMRRWARPGEDGNVPEHFVMWNGKPVSSVTKGFAHGVELAGIDHATPHTLRHTAATWQMQAGTEPWEAAGFLGMGLEMLVRVYGHHHPDHLKGAAAAYDSPRLRVVKLEKPLETKDRVSTKVLK